MSLFTDDLNVHVENLKESIGKVGYWYKVILVVIYVPKPNH